MILCNTAILIFNKLTKMRQLINIKRFMWVTDQRGMESQSYGMLKNSVK